MEIYNITANSWSTGSAGGTARYAHSSVLYNEKIYYWGGFAAAATNTVDVYDIARNSWSTGSLGGTARYFHSSVILSNKVYHVAGLNAAGTPINTVDIMTI